MKASNRRIRTLKEWGSGVTASRGQLLISEDDGQENDLFTAAANYNYWLTVATEQLLNSRMQRHTHPPAHTQTHSCDVGGHLPF